MNERSEPLALRNAIMRRPGMYLGNVENNDAADLVTQSLVVNAVHFRGAMRVSVSFDDSGRIAIDDDGSELEASEDSWQFIATPAHHDARWATAPQALELSIVAASSSSLTVRTGEGVVTFVDARRLTPSDAEALPESARIL